MYNFDQVIPRIHTNSVKWDGTESKYGAARLLPMWIADMDFKAPFQVLDTLKQCAEFGVFGYTQCPDSLKTVVQSWLSRRYKWEVDDRNIIFNHNVVSSISLAIRALTDRGDKVLLHCPVYNPFFEQLNQLGRVPVFSNLIIEDGRYVMDTEDMEKKLSTEHISCILLCSPHNPGGRVWSEKELQKVIDLSERYHCSIISDEIHSDIILSGCKHTPVAQLAGSVRKDIVTLMAPTKTFNLAGIGPSFILSFNDKTAGVIKELQKKMVYPEISPFQIAALTAAYENGEAWLNELIPYIEKNINLVTAKLSEIPGIRCMKNEGTYLMWIDYRKLGFDEKEVNQALIELGVALQMGSTYGPEGNGFVRMNVAAPRSVVHIGADRTSQAFQKLLSHVNAGK